MAAAAIVGRDGHGGSNDSCEAAHPYSKRTYLGASMLFDRGKFKLINPDLPFIKPLEITIAPTLLELQHIVGFTLTRPLSMDAATLAEEEPPAILDLSPVIGVPIGASVLVPLSEWDAKGDVAREAARLATAWRDSARLLPCEPTPLPLLNAPCLSLNQSRPKSIKSVEKHKPRHKLVW